MDGEAGRRSANRLLDAQVQLIQAPFAIGVARDGVDRGAEELDRRLRTYLLNRQQCALLDRLRPSRRVPVAPVRPDMPNRLPGGTLYLDEVVEANETLADEVSDAVARGDLPVTLGGDHALALGSIAGAARQAERLAVLWIDTHADMNWPEVSPSGRIHGMILGASLGRGPAALTQLGGFGPKLRTKDTYLLGLRDLDPAEKAWLAEGELHAATMDDIDERGLECIFGEMLAAIAASGVDAVHVSLDLDAIDPVIFPGAGSTCWGGLTAREVARLIRLLRRTELPIRSLDVVELDPLLDPTGSSTTLAAGLLAKALGEEQR